MRSVPPFPDEHHPLHMNARAGVQSLVDVDTHTYAAQIARKARILTRFPNDVFECSQEVLPMAWDALQLVLPDMARVYPQLFGLERDANRWSWINKMLGHRHTFTFGDDDSINPLRLLASQTQEDWVLLAPNADGALAVAGGDVRFPAGWSLREKIGQDFFGVHAPVPGANAAIGAASDLLLRRLKSGRSVGRWNVAFSPTRLLFLHPRTARIWKRTGFCVTPENAGQRVFVRSEWQVLSRLPETGGILFSIRTHLQSVETVAHSPELRERLQRAIQKLSPEMRTYRGMDSYADALCAYLTRAE